MVEDKKKIVMIVIAVVCLALAVALAIKNFGGGGTSTAAQESQVMLCVNPDCGHIFEMSAEERRQIMRDRGRSMTRGGPLAFTCPKCGEESAYAATKCSKCGTVYIQDYTSGDFADRCPECGYSAIEERRQQKAQ